MGERGKDFQRGWDPGEEKKKAMSQFIPSGGREATRNYMASNMGEAF